MSSARILCPHTVEKLHEFHSYKDGGENAISRRWALVIRGLPANASADLRAVQAMLFASDASDFSGLDGSTFGEASVWEHVLNPKSDSILLEVDFTKVRSQGHSFGLHIQITHDVFVDTAITPVSIDEEIKKLIQQ